MPPSKSLVAVLPVPPRFCLDLWALAHATSLPFLRELLSAEAGRTVTPGEESDEDADRFSFGDRLHTLAERGVDCALAGMHNGVHSPSCISLLGHAPAGHDVDVVATRDSHLLVAHPETLQVILL